MVFGLNGLRGPNGLMGVHNGGGEAAPENTVAPAISGASDPPVEDETISVSNGTWDNSPSSFSYQWYRAVVDGGEIVTDSDAETVGTPISGATSSSYLLVEGDIGEQIFCEVTATNGGGSTTALSDVTAAVEPILVNGDFATNDLTGWTDLSTGTASIDASSGAAVFSGVDGSNRAILHQELALTPDVSWTLTWSYSPTSGGGTTVYDDDNGGITSTANTNINNETFTFTPTFTPVWIKFYTNSSGGQFSIDNVELHRT